MTEKKNQTEPASPVTDERLGIDETMALLDLGRAAVYRKVKDGELASQKTDGRLTFARLEVETLRDKLAAEQASANDELRKWFVELDSTEEHGDADTRRAEAAPVVDAAPLADAAPVADAVPVADVGQRLLERAFTNRIEDVYIDPVVDGDRLVFHAGGCRKDLGMLSARLATDLKKWLKDKAGVIPGSDGSGQGIGQIEIAETQRQFRADVLPTLMGEHLHLRLFCATAGLDDLGYQPAQLKALRRQLTNGSGLILLTDAADAWSERHRRALSQEMSQAGHLVVSLEHRLQYRSELLVQLDLAAEGRPPFTDLWRSALALDPDALLVDELRDADAARAAIDGASGCLVVAQMMAADAETARRRLAKWEIDLEALDRVLLATVERSHVRRLCSHCRQEAAGDDDSGRRYRPVGCDRCRDGFSGVQAVCGVRIAGAYDPSLSLSAALQHAYDTGLTADTVRMGSSSEGPASAVGEEPGD